MVDISEAIVRDRVVSQLKQFELPTLDALVYVTLLIHSTITANLLLPHKSDNIRRVRSSSQVAE